MSQPSWAKSVTSEAENRSVAPPIYEALYGVRLPPFELTPNPQFLHLTTQHLEALSNLEYGLSTAKPITVLVGEAGTGKTTLLGAAMASDRCRGVQCVCLRNPALTRAEFVELLARQFRLSDAARTSKASLLEELESLLRERRTRQEITALIIDEAQTVSDEILEEIRLLANIEEATERFLPLVLVGQPELAARLNHPRLRQLKQRVALRCEIKPFSLWDTASYITARIQTAGGDAARMFTRDAVVMIHERARGIPRTINVICENALLTGLALDQPLIGKAIIQEVCKDFDYDSHASGEADRSEQTEPVSASAKAGGENHDGVPQRIVSSSIRPGGILGLFETPPPTKVGRD